MSIFFININIRVCYAMNSSHKETPHSYKNTLSRCEHPIKEKIEKLKNFKTDFKWEFTTG